MTRSIKNTLIKRQLCFRCQRAESGCICQWIQPTASATEVLILQHPLEVNQVKGSARLLSLSLSNSRIEVGESFTALQLQALLTGPWAANAAAQSQRQAILLYPELPQDAANDQFSEIAAHSSDPTHLRLVVIDGSWRKSRKMLYLNPLLQGLPRVRLEAVPISKYTIRKAHRPDQLSTFEATCVALMLLEGTAKKFTSLLAGFDGFIQQQIQAKSLATDPHKRNQYEVTHEIFRVPR